MTAVAAVRSPLRFVLILPRRRRHQRRSAPSRGWPYGARACVARKPSWIAASIGHRRRLLDDRGQRWTYDPEAHVLLNATGTALSINWHDSNYNVWSEPFAFLAYGPDSTGLSQPDTSLVNACNSTNKDTKLPNKRQDQCIAQLPKGVPYPVKYTDSSTVTWQADQANFGQIVPGVTAPFSDSMEPNAVMSKGQFRVSANNKYELALQMDGNLVLFKKDWGNSSIEKVVKL
jgi:hypothetical protein